MALMNMRLSPVTTQHNTSKSCQDHHVIALGLTSIANIVALTPRGRHRSQYECHGYR